MERSYGRKTPDSVRYPHVALNVVGHCHSSACVELGNTRVICAVHHPQQLIDEYRGERGRIGCTVRRSARASKGALPLRSGVTPEKDMALALEGIIEQVVILEKIPQLLVELSVEILADDGGLWDAVATSASAALAGGGFEMYDSFSACSAALLHDGALVVDPDEEEECSALAATVACVTLNAGDICYLSHRGMSEPATVTGLVSSALAGALSRGQAIRAQLCEQAAHQSSPVGLAPSA
ncbi:3' exoribonuclease family domain [Trypanosoma vivax]|uniref:Putative exosome-associated protein 4 n=1 Tax=Trypanosoma vivax (strain Y486) TaxID=1055687 RepID=G0UD08_TRYVY|nr:putative exosome-associated protein 4 [Trypanosoma vivax]KAH8608131.1 3' exoribonuclease family domain [Trypanosoma vivax]CCC53718.1 putative exosome-associated protein 4 [Trypanosoma vivax Y486]